MQNAQLTQHLILIEERLSAIEAAQNPGALSLIAQRLASIDAVLQTRVPAEDIRTAIEDVLDTRFEMGQLREVYTSQRDQLFAHSLRIDVVLAAHTELDQELRDLLVQLRELGRKHVRGLADLERVAEWHDSEAERRGAT